MAIITTEDLKPYITFDDNDTVKIVDLGNLIDSAGVFITSWIGFNPENEDINYRSILTLNSNQICLPNKNIIGLDSLKLNDYIYTEILEIPREGEPNGTDYWLDYKSGIITFPYLFFAGGYKIEAKYNIGFTTIPYDLKQACCELVTWKYSQRENKGIGVKSQLMGDNTTTFESGIPYSIRLVLDSYK